MHAEGKMWTNVNTFFKTNFKRFNPSVVLKKNEKSESILISECTKHNDVTAIWQ